MPAFIPFMLAGVFAMLSAGVALEATGVSQSRVFTKAPTPPPPPPPPALPSRSNQPRKSPPPPLKPAPVRNTAPTATTPAPAAAVVPEPVSLPPAEAAPATPAASPAPAPVVVKSANIETILFNDEKFSSEFLVDLLFESVAGQELLTIARNDTVNGQDVVYQPIKNLNILQDTYNPTKLLAVYDTSDSFFGAFAIDLSSKIPSVGTGPGGKNYYLTALGDLVIEVVNIANDEQVEFQIADSGTIDELGI
jgi:hypothetical protein